MKKRILSIMDTSRKKAGCSIICCALVITMGTGFALTANAADPARQRDKKHISASRADSLTESFAKYEDFGVTYDAGKDAVFYNEERVKLFVDFMEPMEEGMTYAFDLCYHDSDTSSKLYLEAVKDSDGDISGIRPLKEKIAEEILEAMNGTKTGQEKGQSVKDKDSRRIVTMDATQKLEKYGIVATDIIPTDESTAGSVKDWMTQCDEEKGVYIKTSKSEGQYLTYIYYNGGGRYPWYLSVDNGAIKLELYSDTELPSANEGYCLISFTAPKEYKDIILYLDKEKLN